MAKAKMIKEVEVKFSPAFEKAINGVKTTKKAKTKTKKSAKTTTKAKTKQRKAVAKPKTPKVPALKAPRGYKITKVERELTLSGVKDTYELYELTSKKMEQPKVFVSYDHAVKYIDTIENEILQVKALTGKTHGGMLARGIMAETKELAAAAELPELNTELPEKCDKTSVEDIDA